MDQNLEKILRPLKSSMDEMGYDWNGVWRSLIEEEKMKGKKFEEVMESLKNMMDRSMGMPKYILLSSIARFIKNNFDIAWENRIIFV